MTSEASGIPCPACQAMNAPGGRFCSQCAAPLEAAGATGEVGERKQVSVLFSDLTGYTTLSERLDPEETREIMGRIFGRAAEIVGRYEGRIEKFIGDAVMAIFGTPEAHEDDPVRAVAAALELHQAVAEMAPEIEARTGAAVALHSGINTGMVVTGELRFGAGSAGPVGDTINTAARLMGLAPTGEIWIGPLTQRLTAGRVETEDLGAQQLKGKADSLAAARVLGLTRENTTARSATTPFIGRQAELGALLAAVESVRDGRGNNFAIRADAGGGKTRLVKELRTRLAEDVRWLEGRAYAYSQRTPFFLIIDLLNRAFDIDEDDSREAMIRKLEGGITELLPEARDVLPVIGSLYEVPLGDGTKVDKEDFVPRLTGAVRALLQAGAEKNPTVACLQDLHWADDSSAVMIRELLSSELPIVFVVNYRPGFELGLPGVSTFDLPALSGRQTGELLTSLLDGAAPEELVAFVEKRAGGNPFFTEEVVNSLIETGALVREEAGWRLAGSLEKSGVPTTIQGVLAARIDRLDEPRRRLLREAAVVGREFLYDIVRRISSAADGLDQSLVELQGADLIREGEQREYVEYVFKHALTQEVAYEGMLRNERQALHARVAEAIEELLAHRLAEFAETLAYHYQRGGVAEKAAHYLIEAGRKAFDRYALETADQCYREAFELLAEAEPTAARDRLLARALIGWSDCRYYDVNTIETGALLDRYLPRIEALDDPGLLALYRARMAVPRILALEIADAREVAHEAARLGREHGVAEAEAFGLTRLCMAELCLGRIAEAKASGEAAVAASAPLPETHDAQYDARLYLAIAQLTAGNFERGRALRTELLERVERTGQQRAAPAAFFVGAYDAALRLDFEAVDRESEAGLAIVKDPLYRGWLLGYLAISQFSRGLYEEACRTADAHLAHHDGRPAEFCLTVSRFYQGLKGLVQGNLGQGMQACQTELERGRSAGQRWTALQSNLGLAEVYTSMAAREIAPDFGALLRNPGFVVRHALPAARRARELLEASRREIEATGMAGFSGMVSFQLARLHASQRRDAEARSELGRCAEFLRAAGDGDLPPQVRELSQRLGREE
jgi:predicted ATPase/class 3 adenylate cyclase